MKEIIKLFIENICEATYAIVMTMLVFTLLFGVTLLFIYIGVIFGLGAVLIIPVLAILLCGIVNTILYFL